MENNIKIWRKPPLIKNVKRSFFLVNEQWVKDNKRFIKENGLDVEYPEKFEEPKEKEIVIPEVKVESETLITEDNELITEEETLITEGKQKRQSKNKDI